MAKICGALAASKHRSSQVYQMNANLLAASCTLAENNQTILRNSVVATQQVMPSTSHPTGDTTSTASGTLLSAVTESTTFQCSFAPEGTKSNVNRKS
ncbi:hypothetical protein PC116_g358 [Phytophthora cactorum]|nr:hypothetical protein PC116_g358 [Phytophthora cactorum]